jgi:hypothetical protein
VLTFGLHVSGVVELSKVYPVLQDVHLYSTHVLQFVTLVQGTQVLDPLTKTNPGGGVV